MRTQSVATHFLLAVTLLSHAHGLQIIAGSTSSFTSFHSPEQLVVVLHPAGHRWDSSQTRALAGAEPRFMQDKDGKRYVCYIPPYPSKEQAASHLTAAQLEFPWSGDKSPFQLLERLSTLCLYRQEGLWTYEVCYKKHTRQFRQPSGSGTDKGEDFSCGRYTGDDAQSEEVKVDKASPANDQLKYVSHNFTGGSPCLLSGASRTSEVRFMCMRDVRDNMITSVREFPTCNYIFTVATPLLCRHPQFEPPEDVVRTIHCKHVEERVPEQPKVSAATAITADKQHRHSDSAQAVHGSSDKASQGGRLQSKESELPLYGADSVMVADDVFEMLVTAGESAQSHTWVAKESGAEAQTEKADEASEHPGSKRRFAAGRSHWEQWPGVEDDGSQRGESATEEQDAEQSGRVVHGRAGRKRHTHGEL